MHRQPFLYPRPTTASHRGGTYAPALSLSFSPSSPELASSSSRIPARPCRDIAKVRGGAGVIQVRAWCFSPGHEKKIGPLRQGIKGYVLVRSALPSKESTTRRRCWQPGFCRFVDVYGWKGSVYSHRFYAPRSSGSKPPHIRIPSHTALTLSTVSLFVDLVPTPTRTQTPMHIVVLDPQHPSLWSAPERDRCRCAARLDEGGCCLGCRPTLATPDRRLCCVVSVEASQPKVVCSEEHEGKGGQASSGKGRENVREGTP